MTQVTTPGNATVGAYPLDGAGTPGPVRRQQVPYCFRAMALPPRRFSAKGHNGTSRKIPIVNQQSHDYRPNPRAPAQHHQGTLPHSMLAADYERLEVFTLSDAMELEKPSWLVEGLIASSLTLVTGKPKSGKSGIIQHLISAVLKDQPFLNRPVLGNVKRVIVVGTDPDAVLEYRDRLQDAGVTVQEAGDRLVLVKALRLDSRVCRLLNQQLQPEEGDVLILDHLSDMEGDFNSQADVADIFSAIRGAAGEAAIVVLAHSSTAVGQNGFSSKKPLGSTVIEGKARWILHLEARGSEKRSLTTRGNAGPGEMLHLTLGDHAADFNVESAQMADGDQAAKRRVRSKATLAKRGEQFTWYKVNCQGLSNAEASRRLSAQFGDTPSSWANRLAPSGWLGQMLARP